ncbi:MAG: HlyD family efflux transporter periplasmic adaptor subunit [Planctomycetia bacterium]
MNDLLRNGFRLIAPLAILAAALVAFFWMGSQPPPERKAVEAAVALEVRTVAATAVDHGFEIEADGVVVPLREVTLAAEVGGRVAEKSPACKAGQFVTKGTVLFRIDPRDYELDVSRLERELQQAVLTIDEIDEELTQNANSVELGKRQLEIAKREANRLDTLAQGRIVTESAADQAARDELTTTNTLSNLQGQRRVLQKRRNRLEEAQQLASTMLERASLDLARTTITAPVDGMVVDDKVEQESFVAKGTPLVVLEDTSAGEVKTSLRMDEVAQVWGGMKDAVVPPDVDRSASGTGGAALAKGPHDLRDARAKVLFTLGDRAYEWDGLLSRQEGRGIDEKTRTLPCRVIVPDPTAVVALDRYGAPMPDLPPGAPGSLLRGMFVEVRVKVDPPVKLVSVPQEVVRPSGDLLVMRDGRLAILRPRPYHLGKGTVVYEEGPSGLVAGDRLVSSLISNPRDGMALAEAAPLRTGLPGEESVEGDRGAPALGPTTPEAKP